MRVSSTGGATNFDELRREISVAETQRRNSDRFSTLVVNGNVRNRERLLLAIYATGTTTMDNWVYIIAAKIPSGKWRKNGRRRRTFYLYAEVSDIKTRSASRYKPITRTYYRRCSSHSNGEARACLWKILSSYVRGSSDIMIYTLRANKRTIRVVPYGQSRNKRWIGNSTTAVFSVDPRPPTGNVGTSANTRGRGENRFSAATFVTL